MAALWKEAAEWMGQKPNPQWTVTDPEVLKGFYQDRFSEGRFLLFCEMSGLVVAAVVVQESNVPSWGERGGEGKALFLRSMATARRFKGKGLGSALLSYCATWARSLGRNLLRLECQTTNQDLCDYYFAQGFEVVGHDPTKEVPHHLLEFKIKD